MKFLTFVCLFVCLFALPACDTLDDRLVDSKKFNRAMRDRKPQRITPKALDAWVRKKGTAWCFLAQKDLYRQVKRSLADSSLKKIADFDALPALPVVDSLVRQYEMEMKGYSLSKKYDISPVAQELLKAFGKQASQESIVKEVGKEEKIYFASPIVIDNEAVGVWLIALPLKQARRWYDYKDLR